MTTETQQMLAALQGLHDSYHGKITEIDGRLDTATQRVGDTRRTFFIDAVAGNDANDGTSANPLKTMQHAVTRSVWGGHLTIALKTDYHVDNTVQFSSNVEIESDIPGVKRRLTFADRADDVHVGTPRLQLPLTVNAMYFSDIIFVSTIAAPHILRKHMIASHGLTIVTMMGGGIEVPAGADVALFQKAQGLGFMVQSMTYPPEMAGLWYEGVAAGTLPSTQPMIAFTNLATL